MEKTLSPLIVLFWFANAIFQIHAQGYIVPNGVTYGGYELGFGYGASAAITNSIPIELRDAATIWGDETNDFCVGLSPWENKKGHSTAQAVTVFLLTSRNHTMWNYVMAPGKKFSKMELCDSNGVIISPLSGKLADDKLPLKILEEDLPTTPKNKHLGRLWVMAFGGHPTPVTDLTIQDVYQIKHEGDYTLTICVAIYEFSTDRKSLSRMDLPCVTTKIHLKPSE